VSPKVWRRAASVQAIGPVLVPAATFCALLLLWEVAVRALRVPQFLLPPPSAVARGFAGAPWVFIYHGWVTSYETVLGFAAAILIAVPIAALIVLSPSVYRALAPVLVMIQAIPKVAVAPIVLVWLGAGLDSKIAMAVLIAFFPIIVDTATGLASANPDLILMARSLRASRWQTLLEIQFPTALPMIFSGLKVAVTLALVGAVIGEFVGAEEGLGYLILFYGARRETAEVLAAIIVLGSLGIVLFGAVAALDRLCVWWKPAAPEGALGAA
jgi:NitT/TauT family transport system permease protein